MFKLQEKEEEIQFFNNLPSSTLDDVSELIKEFNSMKLEDLSDKYIHHTIDKLTECYFMLPYTIKSSMVFFRVRLSKDWVLYDHINDLKYPPKNNIKLGRANDSTFPVFYAASSPETAFAECRLKANDLFYLAQYSIHKETTAPLLYVIGDLDNIRRKSNTVLNDHRFLKAYENILENIRPDIKLAIQLVDAFFVDWISKKGEDNYKITSKIFKEFFTAQNLSCIFYPSVEHSGGYNYAFTAEAYDSYLIPEQVSVCYVEKTYGYGAYEIKQSPYYGINNTTGKIELDLNIKDIYLSLKK